MNNESRQIIHTIINYRYMSGNLKPSNDKIKKELLKKHKIHFDQFALYSIHTLPEYINEVFQLIAQNDWANEIKAKASKVKWSAIAYISSVFGIPIKEVAKYAKCIDIVDTTTYQKDFGGRSTSNMRNQGHDGQKDCAVRSLSLATGIDYDTVLTGLQGSQKSNPTTGTFRYAWEKFLNDHEWISITITGKSKRYTFANLIATIPFLAKISLIVNVDRHIFYVDKGIVKDLYDPSHKNIRNILVHKDHYNQVLQEVLQLSDKGLADRMLEIKRIEPNMSWTKVYEAMDIPRSDGYRVRRSYAFQSQLIESEQNWILKPAKRR